MKDAETLTTILEAEAEAASVVYDRLKLAQESIVSLSGAELADFVRSGPDLTVALETLERDRIRCAERLGAHLFPEGSQQVSTMTVHELVRYLPAPDAAAIAGAANRLRRVVGDIIAVNGQNRLLLERSRRFVEETLRIVTEDHTRTLIDQRM
ncbi:MAG TPA: flagellar export chaperone FlgN [Bacteroidota bacterium]|nr:flagellar export chaperone FlgN [Bacteroidota bacterium]